MTENRWGKGGRGVGAHRGRLLNRCLWALLAVSGVALATSARSARPTAWREVAPGFAYRRLRIAASSLGDKALLHVVRVDPGRYRVRLIDASADQTATAREMAGGRKALAVVNGGFFDPDLRPLGLRVTAGRQLRALRRADWGVFLIRDGRPAIVHTRDYRPEGVSEAVQCGPRLVVDGHITRLKQQSARRACVAIDGAGRVLLAVTEGADVDATHLARALSAPATAGGLGVRQALNLDGGPSAQLYAAVGRFNVDLRGTWGVPDGLGVFRP